MERHRELGLGAALGAAAAVLEATSRASIRVPFEPVDGLVEVRGPGILHGNVACLSARV